MSRTKLNKGDNPFGECDREITSEVMTTVSDLTKTGIKVLEYMMSSCATDNGKIYIDKKTVMFECQLKDKSFFNGIKDLIDNNIIATSDISFEYYFNHAYFGETIEK